MAVKKEVEKVISDDQLSGISSFQDALSLLNETYGAEAVVVASQALGDGFALLENKDKLIDEMFVMISWDFHIGDHGEFVSVRLVTEGGKKYIVNDGSTGMCKQLSEYTAKTGRNRGMVVEKGLRRSDYTYTDENGKEKDASTYYLDVAAA